MEWVILHLLVFHAAGPADLLIFRDSADGPDRFRPVSLSYHRPVLSPKGAIARCQASRRDSHGWWIGCR